MGRMAGSYGRCNWSETPKREARAQKGPPTVLLAAPLSHTPPGTQDSAQAFPPLQDPFPAHSTTPPALSSPPKSLPWRPSSAALQCLMHTAPSTELCHSQIPAAPSTSAHRRLPPYPASRCLAHRGSPTALVLKQRKEGEIRLDTQLCRGRMNLGFF